MQRFTKLRVWHEAVAQLQLAVRLTESLRLGDLANQIRRAAISVPANIAEGRGRGSDREFARFVDMARSSNDELANHVCLALAARAVDQALGEEILENNERVGRMLTCLLAKLAAGCWPLAPGRRYMCPALGGLGWNRDEKYRRERRTVTAPIAQALVITKLTGRKTTSVKNGSCRSELDRLLICLPCQPLRVPIT